MTRTCHSTTWHDMIRTYTDMTQHTTTARHDTDVTFFSSDKFIISKTWRHDDTTWQDMTRMWYAYDMTWHGTIWYERTRTWHDVTRSPHWHWVLYDTDVTWHDITRVDGRDTTRHDMPWHTSVFFEHIRHLSIENNINIIIKIVLVSG